MTCSIVNVLATSSGFNLGLSGPTGRGYHHTRKITANSEAPLVINMSDSGQSLIRGIKSTLNNPLQLGVVYDELACHKSHTLSKMNNLIHQMAYNLKGRS